MAAKKKNPNMKRAYTTPAPHAMLNVRLAQFRRHAKNAAKKGQRSRHSPEFLAVLEAIVKAKDDVAAKAVIEKLRLGVDADVIAHGNANGSMKPTKAEPVSQITAATPIPEALLHPETLADSALTSAIDAFIAEAHKRVAKHQQAAQELNAHVIKYGPKA